MIKDFFVFSWNNLVHKKLRSWLTLLGILIGVMSVVSLIGLGDSLKAAVSAQFGISSTEIISVQAGGLAYGPPGSGVVNPLVQKDVEDIKRVSSVETAFSRVIEQGRFEFNEKVDYGFATNIPSGTNRKLVYDILELETYKGRLLKDSDNKKVVLGYTLANDEVKFGKKVELGDTVLFKNEKFEVVGVLKKKGSFILDGIVLINEDPLKNLMENPDRVDIIAVKVKSKDLMDKAKEDIEKVLRKNRNVKVGEEDFQVQTPQAALATVNDVLTGVQIFIILIAIISIVVGAIGIVNTMTTSVLERKKQIGIMKSIGAKNSDIFLQFLIESGLMGLLGGGMGVLFGEIVAFLGAIGINYFLGSENGFEINVFLIILSLIGSFMIGAVSGIVPAMKAARQNPVDALRG